MGEINVVIHAVFLHHAMIQRITVTAVIVVRLHVGIVVEHLPRGADKHIQQEFFLFRIVLDSEIRRLFAQRTRPIVIAALDACCLNALAQTVGNIGIGNVFPVLLDFCLAADIFQELKQLTVGKNKFCTGNHTSASLP